MIDTDGTDRSVSIHPTRFWVDHVDIDGELTPHEFVEWVKKGYNETTTKRIDRLRRDKVIWPILQPYYEHWKQGLGEPVDGTPIDAWPAVTPGLVARLRALHLRSVEDVANADENTLNRIGMGARDLKRKAEAFIANKGANEQAGIVAKLERENELLQGRLAELEEQIEMLANGDEAPKRRPGRPRKVAA